ncbi:MAG: hypothetical protein AAGG50_17965 [Bacteroidota bacterium]
MSRLAALARLALVLCLVASTQSLLVIQGIFALRQDAIAERLCENRDRPELNCDGVCYLTKQLKERQDREREQNKAVLELALTFQLQVAEGVTLDLPADGVQATYGGTALLGWAAGVSDEVFVPPRRSGWA